ncbi:phosphopyruvate hydratase [Candidatus Micrarchaeota archaeon]|nr:phosphopyruvate hydratase [Candidatus Micrarchaeota archaeon]MBD3417512.1 phosphopyruvate hydratase [Candidatus Micrarchaeota archaeon]
MKIKSVFAREIIDSRGNPTIEVDIKTESGGFGRASSPSGASRGLHEAVELRDGGPRFHGKGVLKAVENVNKIIGPAIYDMEASPQEDVDQMMIELDGTKNKEKLGGNAVVAVSMANLKAAASTRKMALYDFMGGEKLPIPLLNIINGGKHAGNGLSIQEFMVIPAKTECFSDGLRAACEIYKTLNEKLVKKYGRTSRNVGDEGGFAPPMSRSSEALDAISESIEECGYSRIVGIGMDAAASSFYRESDGKYFMDGNYLERGQLIDYYGGLLEQYPIYSIEDPLFEEDFEGFAEFTEKFGNKIQVVGDDLVVTNAERVQKAVEMKAMNALLLKVNQIGTVTEARKAAQIATDAGMQVVVSHRSGETEDTFISDLAVGMGATQIKSGAPARGERTAKYNRLLRIEEKLGKHYSQVW